MFVNKFQWVLQAGLLIVLLFLVTISFAAALRGDIDGDGDVDRDRLPIS